MRPVLLVIDLVGVIRVRAVGRHRRRCGSASTFSECWSCRSRRPATGGILRDLLIGAVPPAAFAD